jgi:tetratricopeptide (TPR) repeat protein
MSNKNKKAPKLMVSIEEMKNRNIDRVFNDAINYFLSGDTDFLYTSLHMFHIVIEKNPDYVAKGNEKYGYLEDGYNAYYYLGILYQQNLNDLDSAIKYFSKAIELNPNDYESVFLRGECWSDKNIHDKALFDFKLAKKLGGSDIDYDVDSAIKEAENKLLSVGPNDSTA